MLISNCDIAGVTYNRFMEKNRPSFEISTRRPDARKNDLAILEAAGRIIERDGYIGSVKDVADKAGVGSTTVYRRFVNKDDLQSLAVAHLISSALWTTIERESRNPNPFEALAHIANELAHIALTMKLPESRPSDVLERLLADHKLHIATMLEAAQKQGQIRADITGQDIEGITALLLTGLTIPRALAGSAPRYVAHIFDGLASSDSAPLPPVASGEISA